ncbi:MAG: hypothetical protein KDA78_12225, partial [Planctomycetaceae bacterium]|nr:hypothetical protein [Planctomycetaceae bacterium]
MSKKILPGLLVVLLCCQTSIVFASGWKTLRLNDRFLAEGASAGDLNSDGHLDVVCGPVWYQGPDFQKSHELAPAKEFPVSSYSDQFFSEVVDANADGHPDVIVIGFPGAAARLYLNPGKPAQSGHWEMKEIANIVDNESPAIIDLIPGGLPEIVCGRESQYGYYAATSDPTAPWTWHPISKPGTCGGRFAHGMGVGDVNSDGKLDILDKTYWWEQPANVAEGNQWTQRQWALEAYGGGGAQIQVSDFDGDGDADIVTSLNAHGYGLAWFEQISIDRFERHDIMGMSSIENDYGVAFSQLHALKLEDMDGDGLKDLVTGKRWYAHNGKDIGGLQEPVLYWFQCQRTEEGVEFVPHLVDRNSGVGVDVLVKDLNKDGRPDIVSCSKHGLDVHLQDAAADALRPQRWRVAEGRDQSTYLNDSTPQEAAAQMLVPEGFHVDLIAGEPELTQPIAMCFDARGRIWVVEGHTYPIPAPPGQGRDRILIFADEDANGTFESRKVFQEGLNLVSGIEIGFGGVWVGAAPYFMFIPDANQDDIPDAEPQILLDGWGHQDTHETLNSFTWGPDGWLYGCHGVFTHSRVGKPGTPDADRIPLNAAVWRYHPTNHRFEVYAHGTSNPWGVDYDDQGNWFNTACVIPHLYHIQQGARYQRQAGQHFNPYTYDDIKTIADHAHYAGNIRDHAFWGDNYTARRPSPNDTSMVGGGHAHCGLAIYNADVFPPEYRGDLFFHNLHGHRVVRETLIRDGSGFVGMHRPDFSLSRDHKQIGVGIMVGPDGALYTSDWHDLQTCHHRTPEIWDRTDGRLYRIRYGEVRPQNLNLWKESDQQLVERLSD